MKPFEFKWQCIGMPLKAEEDGGYDVVTTSSMGGGYHPTQITEECMDEIRQISDDGFWLQCEKSICDTLTGFEQNGIALPTQDYIFTIMLNDGKNPMSAMTGDNCGHLGKGNQAHNKGQSL